MLFNAFLGFAFLPPKDNSSRDYHQSPTGKNGIRYGAHTDVYSILNTPKSNPNFVIFHGLSMHGSIIY